MHLCPSCHSVCRCGGDYDDIDMTGFEDIDMTGYRGYVACIHFLLPECGADDEDWDERGDDWSKGDGEREVVLRGVRRGPAGRPELGRASCRARARTMEWNRV